MHMLPLLPCRCGLEGLQDAAPGSNPQHTWQHPVHDDCVGELKNEFVHHKGRPSATVDGGQLDVGGHAVVGMAAGKLARVSEGVRFNPSGCEVGVVVTTCEEQGCGWAGRTPRWHQAQSAMSEAAAGWLLACRGARTQEHRWRGLTNNDRGSSRGTLIPPVTHFGIKCFA